MLMRYLRQVPLLIKMAGVLALPLGIVALALATRQFMLLLRQPDSVLPADTYRMQAVSMGIGQLGTACIISVGLYTARIRKAAPIPLPLGAPLPPDSWKLQLTTFLIPAMLPLCLIVMALVISPDSRWFGSVFVAEILGSLVIIACVVWLLVRMVETLSQALRGRRW